MTTLTDLAARLAALVPPSGGAPTTAQYQQAARDAVADFGRRVPRSLIATLSIVSGTATYSLPAGFQKVIRLDVLAGRDVQRNALGFLVPPPLGGWKERYTVSGGQITFYPTPGYTLERALLYAAGYPYLSASDTFDGLTEELEGVALLKAQATVAGSLALQSTGGGFSYRIGDVSVDKGGASQSYGRLADDAEAGYLTACRSLVGRLGKRSSYDGTEYSEQ